MARLIDEEFARQLIGDLDKLQELIREIQGMGKEEKKAPRKLAQILKDSEGPRWTHDDLAKAAIDAVIECYKEWQVDFSCDKAVLTFPEYLKEKLL